MWAPQSVRVDNAGKVYVADSQPGGGSDLGGRILIFNPPLTSGMNANSSLGAGQLRNPTGLDLNTGPDGGFWVNDTTNTQLLLYVNGVVSKGLV